MRNICIETEQHWLTHVLVGVLSNINADLGAFYKASGWVENSSTCRNKFYNDRSASGLCPRTWVTLVITITKVTKTNKIITGCSNGPVKI